MNLNRKSTAPRQFLRNFKKHVGIAQSQITCHTPSIEKTSKMYQRKLEVLIKLKSSKLSWYVAILPLFCRSTSS